MEQQEVKLTAKEAKSVLSFVKSEGRLRGHCLQGMGRVLMGWNHDRKDILEDLAKSTDIFITWDGMKFGHAVCMLRVDRNEYVSLETDKDKLKELLKSKGIEL